MYDHVLIPNKMNEVLCQMIRRNALNETKGMQRLVMCAVELFGYFHKYFNSYEGAQSMLWIAVFCYNNTSIVTLELKEKKRQRNNF